MKARLPGVSVSDFETSVFMKMKWYEGVKAYTATVKLGSGESEDFSFDMVSEAVSDGDDSHFIEFRAYFEIVKAEPAKTGDYRYRINKINNRFRSALTTHIKKIITDEDLTNQYMFRMLMQIDSKLDELLDSMRSDDDLEGLTDRKVVSLGGGGLAFSYDRGDVQKDDLFYVQSMPKNGSGINFAAMCRVTDVIDTGENSICEASFEYMDESTKETIIHYIFQKDREHLKRLRN